VSKLLRQLLKNRNAVLNRLNRHISTTRKLQVARQQALARITESGINLLTSDALGIALEKGIQSLAL
jgi:hypothetical protein